MRFQLYITLTLLGCFSTAQANSDAVASAHPLATKAGMDILRQGGNAFDAAVAVTAVLAVVEPYSSGIGGGGFYLLHQAEEGRNVFLDAREKAPRKSHRDMYLDENGDPLPRASLDGALAAGIPGIPAALDHLAERYGKLPLSDLLNPAIELAENGFSADARLIRLTNFRKKPLMASAAGDIFLPNGEPPRPEQLIVQHDLAGTLKQIAGNGREAFYQGDLAETLVHEVQKGGGIWQIADLTDYQVVERDPIESRYHDMTLVSAPPPSSGGIVLATALNILSGFDLATLNESSRIHLVVEAMRRAYRDRAHFLGDSDFVDVPVEKLISRARGDVLRQSIRLETASNDLSALSGEIELKGTDTTHFSIIDKWGNRVAATLSVNYPFGSGFMPAGTGVLLNNEMDDFSLKPGVPNVYGLVGGEANAIAPGKRMLSSMTPTFLETPDRLAVIGTPGGSRIISMVLLASLKFYDNGSAPEIVALPRYHHQFLPNEIQHEPQTFNAETAQALQNKGHTLKQRARTYGNMHVILLDKKSGAVTAAADPRGLGSAAVH